MKLILKVIFFCLILAAICSIGYGQILVPFAGTRTTDTAYAARSLRIDSVVRLLKYSSDSTHFLYVNSRGFLTIATVPVLTPIDTTSLSNRINLKLNISDTTGKWLHWSDTLGNIATDYDVSLKLTANPTITGATKTKITYDAKGLVTAGANATVSDISGLQTTLDSNLKTKDTAAMLLPYLRKIDTIAMLSPYLRKVDTSSLSARINLKLNIADTGDMLNPYLRKVDTAAKWVHISDSAGMLLPYLRKVDTTAMLSPYFRKIDTTAKWVHLTGAEVIAGQKTFSSNPILSGLTSGSIPYINSSKVLSENNSALFWDNAGGRLGIGTPSPASALHVNGTSVDAGASSGGVGMRLQDARASGNNCFTSAVFLTRNVTGVINAATSINFGAPFTTYGDGMYFRSTSSGKAWVATIDDGIAGGEKPAIILKGAQQGVGYNCTLSVSHSLVSGWNASDTATAYNGVSLFGGYPTIYGDGAKGSGCGFGYKVRAIGFEACAFGPQAEAIGFATIAIGDGAKCWPTGPNGNELSIGDATYCRGNGNIMIGEGNGIDSDFVMCLGCLGGSTSHNLHYETGSHQAILGGYDTSSSYYTGGSGLFNDWLFGGPWRTRFGHDISFNIPSAFGTNQAGKNWIFNASASTGNTTGGDFIFNTSDIGVSGSTLQSFSEKMRVKHDGGVSMKGTITNDDATAGNIGEFTSSTIASGSAVSLTTNTATNITSISLTAGDWDVTGVVNFTTTGASSSDFKSGTNSTSATYGGENTYVNLPLIATGLSDVLSQNEPTTRYSLASTTTIYLLASSTFTLGSINAYGTIRARRVR